MPDRFLRALLVLVHHMRQRGPSLLVPPALLVLALGAWAFVREARVAGLSCRWDEGLYLTAGLFTFSGNRFGFPRTRLLEFIYFAAPAISASALLGAAAQLLESQVPLVMRRARGHVVVGGLGNLGTTLARHQASAAHLVMGLEKDPLAAGVALLRASGQALVLEGDMTQVELLQRARAPWARRVFFVSHLDAVNLDAAFQLRRLIRARAGGADRPPDLFAHVYDMDLSDALRDQLLPKGPGDPAIQVFNSYRFAAKALLAGMVRDGRLRGLRVAPGLVLRRTDWPGAAGVAETHGHDLAHDLERLGKAFRLEREADGGEAERFAVVGLGRFGRAVLRELLDAAPTGARFLVVERSEEAVAQGLESLSAAERARLEVHVGDATGPSALAALDRLKPSAALICTDNDICNLRLALTLQKKSVRTVMRMFDLENSAELSNGLDERGLQPVGLAQLFRTAIPILTHERKLLGCIDLDFNRTPAAHDHLFYLARVTQAEKDKLGHACVELESLARDDGVPAPPPGLALVWSHEVMQLGVEDAG
jgi:Trk K+ transport system NAD-binding subunit